VRSQDEDMYTREANRIAASEDPRAELLNLARFVVDDQRQQRRKRMRLAAVTLVLVGVPALLWALGVGSGEPGVTDPTPADSSADATVEQGDQVHADMAWLAEVRDRPAGTKLTESEISKVLDALAHALPPTRGLALVVASGHGLHVPDDHLLWFLHNADDGDDSVALHLVWQNCARTGSFSRPRMLEPFAIADTRAARKYALRALGSIRKYVASPEVLKSLEGAPSDVVDAAGEILGKTGQ